MFNYDGIIACIYYPSNKKEKQKANGELFINAVLPVNCLYKYYYQKNSYQL